MTKIIELAHALGEEIAKSEQLKNLEAAKNAYEGAAELQAQMSEYQTDRKLLADEFEKGTDEADAAAVDKLKARLEELSRLITANPVYTAFSTAQNAMNELMTSVNDEISFCITGERPNHCTHDCSSCAGCH